MRNGHMGDQTIAWLHSVRARDTSKPRFACFSTS